MLKMFLLGLLWLYQQVISPTLQVYFGSRCRFTPTCSHYTVEAIQKHGGYKGSMLGVKRLLKCHPWHPGGMDLP